MAKMLIERVDDLELALMQIGAIVATMAEGYPVLMKHITRSIQQGAHRHKTKQSPNADLPALAVRKKKSN